MKKPSQSILKSFTHGAKWYALEKLGKKDEAEKCYATAKSLKPT